MKKSKVLLFVILPMLTASVVISCNAQINFHNECIEMRHTYRDMLLEILDTTPYDNKSSEEIMIQEALKPITISSVETYYIEGMNYDDYETRDDSWPAWHHLMKAADIAACGYKKNNPKITDIATKMVYYWVFTDHRSSNWWFNEIGCNRHLTNAAMFIFDKLNLKGQAALLGKLRQSSLYYRPALMSHSGANLIDFADITLKNAILSENQSEFIASVQRMEREIVDTNEEGFQKDGSFFQHGRQVQTCSSYGKSLIRMGNFFHVVSASSYQIDTKRLAIVSRTITEGFASMTHKGYINYSSNGREFVREDILDTQVPANTFTQMKNYLSINNLPDKQGVQDYVDSITNRQSSFSGIKYFDIAKMIAVNTNDLYISFKGTDDYLVNTEQVNEENKLGLNLSYGTNTCVMDKGNEYDDISPLWDYTYIPGTTSINMSSHAHSEEGGSIYNKSLEQSDMYLQDIVEHIYEDSTYEQKLPEEDNNNYIYSSGYDKTNEVAWLMQRSISHSENHFTVSCVATKEGMVLIGADLNYDASQTGTYFSDRQIGTKLHTTIEQCFYKGEHQAPDNKTLIHGNAKYHVLDDNEITLEVNNNFVGHWRRNKNDMHAQPITGNILLAYLDTNTSKKYAYSIQHKDTPNDFTLIHNFDSDRIQEVKLPNGKHVILSYEETTYKGHNLLPGEVIIIEE